MTSPLVIDITRRCNNDCEMCSVTTSSEGDTFQEYRSLDEIAAIMEKNSRRYRHVDFTGGESTVHEELPEMIGKARQIGYDVISISTNGRKLADRDYLDSLKEKGLDHVNIALHSIDMETSRKITGHPENFQETVRALANLSETEVTVSAGTVPMKPNIDRLDEIAELLLNAGVGSWAITRLKPEGDQNDYEDLVVPRRKLAESLGGLKPHLERFPEITLYNFRRCELPEEIWTSYELVTSYDKKDWNFTHVPEDHENLKTEKLDVCSECPHEDRCLGFWQEDLRLRDREKLVSAARKNLSLEQ